MLIIVAAVLLVLHIPSTCSAQPAEVPVDRQVAMMLKVMDSDKHITAGYPCCNVGILFSHHDSSSIAEKNSILQFTSDRPYMLKDGTPVHFVAVDLEHDLDWKDILESDSIATVIVTSVDRRYLEPVTSLSRKRSILTMTTVPEYVREGISVGVISQNDRAMLLINLPVSITEGARISSGVLKMAKIYR